MILMLTRAVSRERTRTTGISRASTLLQVASPVATYVGVLAGWAGQPTEGLDRQAASELLLELRLSGPRTTLVLALHVQQLDQLRWTPDAVVRLPESSLSPSSLSVLTMIVCLPIGSDHESPPNRARK